MKQLNGCDGYASPYRSVHGSYTKTVWLDGVKLYRFSPPESEYLNATLNPENEGFCSPPGNCWDSGVLNNEDCHTSEYSVLSEYSV